MTQQRKSGLDWGSIQHDFMASIVVFLVALPLCMGIAIASGVPVSAGLITGIVGGIVVGSLAGCPLQVSGPAAGLTVIVYEIVQRFGLEMLGLIVLVAGLMQAAAGLMKLGQWFRAVSPAVIRGMLAGIGLLILGSQFHVMMDDKPKGNGAVNLVTIPQTVWNNLAWPQLNERPVRQARAEALRRLADVYQDQLDIEKRLQEFVREEVALSEAAIQQQFDRMAGRLMKKQEGVVQKLSGVTELIQQAGPGRNNGERAQRIQEASGAALAASRQALDSLRQGDPEAALERQKEAVAALDELLAALKNHTLAALIGLVTIVAIVAWPSLAPKKVQFIPAPLVAVVLATAIAAIVALPVLYVDTPDNLIDELRLPTWTLILSAPWMAVLQSALLLAAVASAETLLCATAVDQMHTGPRTQYDRELFAQGVGNTICGFLGALPMTGVIVRSSANVLSGGRTRLSAILHGIWLLIFVVLLGSLLRMIPTSALAAVLVYTGYKLVNVKSIKQLWQYGRGEVVVYLATVGTIVATDLLTGVSVGIGLAAAKLLYTISHLEAPLEVNYTKGTAVLRLRGAATFVRLPRLAAQLDRVPRGVELHVDFEHLDYIDHACLDLLMNWAKQHEATGGKLVLDWDTLHARFYRESANNAGQRRVDGAPSPNGQTPVAEQSGAAAESN